MSSDVEVDRADVSARGASALVPLFALPLFTGAALLFSIRPSEWTLPAFIPSSLMFVVAPVNFSTAVEYPIAIVLGCLVAPPTSLESEQPSRRIANPLLTLLLVLALWLVVPGLALPARPENGFVLFLPLALCCVFSLGRLIAFVLSFCTLIFSAGSAPERCGYNVLVALAEDENSLNTIASDERRQTSEGGWFGLMTFQIS